jgi:hypothetical protein
VIGLQTAVAAVTTTIGGNATTDRDQFNETAVGLDTGIGARGAAQERGATGPDQGPARREAIVVSAPGLVKGAIATNVADLGDVIGTGTTRASNPTGGIAAGTEERAAIRGRDAVDRGRESFCRRQTATIQITGVDLLHAGEADRDLATRTLTGLETERLATIPALAQRHDHLFPWTGKT